MHGLSAETQACVAECLECHSVCLGSAMNHCLEAGGRHTEPAHFRIMMTCAHTCRTSADLMLIGSAMHARMCGVCAEACAACAASCDAIPGMEDCARACRACEASCRGMAA